MTPEPALTRDAPVEQRAPEIIRILFETYPDAKVALNFSNPLEMLVATILSAQCTDEKVNEVTATLFRKYRTPEDYLKVPEDELKDRAARHGRIPDLLEGRPIRKAIVVPNKLVSLVV